MDFTERRSFQSIEARVHEFQALMKHLGLTIKQGSLLDEICQSSVKLNQVDYRINFDNKQDERENWRRIVGLDDLFTNILRVKNHPRFQNLRPHLKLFNDGLVPQNTKNIIDDQAARKIFELFLATLVMTFSNEIKLDSPKNAKGDNPDILFTFRNVRWAIACKVLQSASADRFWCNFEKGIQQIERSEANCGFVCFNFKNILPHDLLIPICNENYKETGEDIKYGAFQDGNIPVNILLQFCEKKREEILADCDYSEDYIINIFRGKKSAPTSLNLCPSTSSIAINGQPILIKVNLFYSMPFFFRNQSFFYMKDLIEIEDLLNNALHKR